MLERGNSTRPSCRCSPRGSPTGCRSVAKSSTASSMRIVAWRQRSRPFLSFDDECFYRRWALDIAQDGDLVLETVFEMCQRRGDRCRGHVGLGVALLSERHLRPEMTILASRLRSPALAYVVAAPERCETRARHAGCEIEKEVNRYGGLGSGWLNLRWRSPATKAAEPHPCALLNGPPELSRAHDVGIPSGRSSSRRTSHGEQR